MAGGARVPLPPEEDAYLRVSLHSPAHTESLSSPMLRTSSLIYVGMASPQTRKLNNQAVTVAARTPDQQPRSPFTPSSPKRQSAWCPDELAGLPRLLAFESWWNEINSVTGGLAKRIPIHVTFDTHTKDCMAGTHVSVLAEVTLPNGEPIDIWDLHVGAQMRLLGKRITLQKALNQATRQWLDDTAFALLTARTRLLDKLNKYRPVQGSRAQHAIPQRCEEINVRNSQQRPAGGRLNLRALRAHVQEVADTLRQHTCMLPSIPSTLMRSPHATGGSSRSAPGTPGGAAPPSDWSPARRLAEAAAEEERRERVRQSMLRREAADRDTHSKDLLLWLASNPLTASAAKITASDLEAHAAPTQAELLNASPSARLSLTLNLDMIAAASASGQGQPQVVAPAPQGYSMSPVHATSRFAGRAGAGAAGSPRASGLGVSPRSMPVSSPSQTVLSSARGSNAQPPAALFVPGANAHGQGSAAASPAQSATGMGFAQSEALSSQPMQAQAELAAYGAVQQQEELPAMPYADADADAGVDADVGLHAQSAQGIGSSGSGGGGGSGSGRHAEEGAAAAAGGDESAESADVEAVQEGDGGVGAGEEGRQEEPAAAQEDEETAAASAAADKEQWHQLKSSALSHSPDVKCASIL